MSGPCPGPSFDAGVPTLRQAGEHLARSDGPVERTFDRTDKGPTRRGAFVTLHRLRPFGERLLAPVVPLLRRIGLPPDAISASALGTAAAAATAFAHESYLVGVVLLVGSGWLDVLDGMLARAVGAAGPGGFLLDQTVDRYADLLIVVGLAVGADHPVPGLAAVTGVVMTSFVGLEAEAVGLGDFLTGFFCRADRLTLVAVAGLTAATSDLNPIGPLLVAIAVVGHLTAVFRFYRIRRAVG